MSNNEQDFLFHAPVMAQSPTSNLGTHQLSSGDHLASFCERICTFTWIILFLKRLNRGQTPADVFQDCVSSNVIAQYYKQNIELRLILKSCPFPTSFAFIYKYVSVEIILYVVVNRLWDPK